MDIKTILHELSNEVIEKISNFEVKEIKANGKNWTFEVIASDETVDRSWEVIKVSGWDIENYMKNPIILFGHDYRDINNIVGKATEVINNWKQLIIKGIFAWTETAQTARQLYDEGILKTVSVGFRILERGEDEERSVIKRAELLELSFVPVPCNPNALDIAKELVEKGFEFGILEKVWDETDANYRHRVKEPEEFEEWSFRTKTIQAKPEIKVIFGKLKGEDTMTVQSVLFKKDDRTLAEAKKWVKDHPEFKEVEVVEQKDLESKVDMIIEKMTGMENQLTEIKWFLVSKKETDSEDDTEKAKEAMQKIAIIASTAIKKLKN